MNKELKSALTDVRTALNNIKRESNKKTRMEALLEVGPRLDRIAASANDGYTALARAVNELVQVNELGDP